MRKSISEILVGVFMIAGAIALLVLAFKVSGLANYSYAHYYHVTADFDNIGDLKVRAPVTIGGVKIGQVTKIALDNTTFRARVTLAIDDKMSVPTDSSASIFTAGLLGSNYISLTPGFDDTSLKEGGHIQITHPALILENLIGQLLFSFKDGKKDKDSSSTDKNTP